MTMKNDRKKLSRYNVRSAKDMQTFEDIMFLGRQQFRNSAVEAQSAETHALKLALEHAYERMDNYENLIVDLMKEINSMKTMLMKGVRDGDIRIVEETTTTTSITTIEVKGRQPKWDKEKIFRAFDLYRRDHALFSNITPQIVRDNWSTLLTQSRKYTDMTLGELLKEYARERSLNY
jgi:hypothetical protein